MRWKMHDYYYYMNLLQLFLRITTNYKSWKVAKNWTAKPVTHSLNHAGGKPIMAIFSHSVTFVCITQSDNFIELSDIHLESRLTEMVQHLHPQEKWPAPSNVISVVSLYLCCMHIQYWNIKILEHIIKVFLSSYGFYYTILFSANRNVSDKLTLNIFYLWPVEKRKPFWTRLLAKQYDSATTCFVVHFDFKLWNCRSDYYACRFYITYYVGTWWIDE